MKIRVLVTSHIDREEKYCMTYNRFYMGITKVRGFKSALMPSNPAEFKIVIMANKKPQAEHRGCYNTFQIY